MFGAWTALDVAVALTSEDDAHGSGVESLSYSLTGAVIVPPSTTAGTAAFTVSAEGETAIRFHATDVAGNVEAEQTRIVRIDRSAPSVTVAADQTTLWPPSGRPVAVTVSGHLTDGVSGIGEASYRVTDEYGATQPSGEMSVRADGSFEVTVMLPASRRGDDKDGRAFTIHVDAIDRAGNPASSAVIVTVPHDQR